MENRSWSYTVEDVIKRMNKKTLSFDFPIQRESGQWDKEQKSLFIDTIFNGYLVPEVYIIKEGTDDFCPMSVLDGKQRLTTIYDYYNDGFKLSKDLDSITINDFRFDDEKNRIDNIKTYEIANKSYSQLDDSLKEIFKSFKINAKLLAGYTDEQVEEQFYRLNNGSVFTKAQKATVKLGTELAGKIKEIEENDFFTNRACFTNSQKKRGEVTSCILQTLMLLTGYNYKNFGANEVLKFAEYFNENPDYKQLEYCSELFDKLFSVLPYSEDIDKQLKKIHIPMLIMNLDAIDGLDVDYELTDDEYKAFLNKWFEVWNETSGYTDFCGTGSTGKSKVEGRVSIMTRELRDYVIKLSIKNGNEENDYGEEEDFRTETAS